MAALLCIQWLHPAFPDVWMYALLGHELFLNMDQKGIQLERNNISVCVWFKFQQDYPFFMIMVVEICVELYASMYTIWCSLLVIMSS